MNNTTTSFGRMKLGEYLCRRLYAAGCHDVFAVPGDFNLALFDKVIESDLRYVGCCNELNASYAADGYARVQGLGCVMTTYAVGELSAINGIAGAYAECVPVVKIVGGPQRKFFKDMPLLHHTLGDYMTPYKMYVPVTVDQCLLNDPRFAARDFERCLKNCLLYKRPIYVLVPSDMVSTEIELTEGYPGAPSSSARAPADSTVAPPTSAPESPVARMSRPEFPRLWSTTYIEEPASSPQTLEEAVDEVVSRLRSAKRPVFLPGVELIRRGLQTQFLELTTKSHIPYATMLLSKGLITESHPNFMGLYMGGRSSPEVRAAIANSDCVVILGEKLTDFNTGGFTSDFKTKSRILVNFDEVHISNHVYRHVYIYEFMQRLLENVPIFPDPAYDYPRAKYGCPNRRDSIITTNAEDNKLTMNFVFKKLAKSLPENCIFMAETGASMFAAAETMLPDGGTYIGQTFYGSIGFTLGACLGACIAIQDQEKHGSMRAAPPLACPVKSGAKACPADAAVSEPSGAKSPAPEVEPAPATDPSVAEADSKTPDVVDFDSAKAVDAPATPLACMARPSKAPRVILSIGDGSFQLTAQELSTMIRNKCNPIILLVNNDGYTIERVITDNVYNDIARWNYSMVPKVFGGEQGICARTEEEFDQALRHAMANPKDLCFIEAILDKWDCNKLLKAAGRMMALNNNLNPSMTEDMIQNSRH